MADFSKLIFKEYKAANIIDMTIENRILAYCVRFLLIALFLFVISVYLKNQESHPLASSAGMLLFMVTIVLVYLSISKYNVKKHNLELKKMNLSSQELSTVMLKRILMSYNLYSKDGIEYLIRIYKKKSQIVDISWGAIIGIILSTILNNLISAIFLNNNQGGSSAYQYLSLVNEIIKSNLEIIFTITLLILLFTGLFIYIYKNTKTLIQVLFGFGYSSLIYSMEYILLPDVLSAQSKGSHQPMPRKRIMRNKVNVRRK